jgi:hypothetical protein
MLASPALPFVLSFAAGALVAGVPVALHYRSRLSAVKFDTMMATARDLVPSLRAAEARTEAAEARLSAIHNQHVEAGKKAHEAERTKRAETTRALAMSIGRPDLAERINDPLEAGRGVSPASSARAGFGLSAPLSHSCGGSAAPKMDGSGGIPDMPTGRGRGHLLRRERRPHSGNSAAEAASGNRAVESIPADFTMKKGAN